MDPGLQVKVRREDRVRIVSMPSVRAEEAADNAPAGKRGEA
jgi:hypothetical protein